MERGHRYNNDFSQCLEKDTIVKYIIISRARLLFAHHNKISAGGNYVTTEPVRIYKHYQQVRYDIA